MVLLAWKELICIACMYVCQQKFTKSDSKIYWKWEQDTHGEKRFQYIPSSAVGTNPNKKEKNSSCGVWPWHMDPTLAKNQEHSNCIGSGQAEQWYLSLTYSAAAQYKAVHTPALQLGINNLPPCLFAQLGNISVYIMFVCWSKPYSAHTAMHYTKISALDELYSAQILQNVWVVYKKWCGT